MGISEAVVDPEMPVAVADRLRSDGIGIQPDHETTAARRRVKTAAELAGIRRAQTAAEAGMSAAAAVLSQAVPDSRPAHVRGRGPHRRIGSDRVARCLSATTARRLPPDVIVASVWQGYGHDAGSGPLPAHLPIVIDLWPRDELSGCWADMTRTFVVGEIDAAVSCERGPRA